jgi:hypothetical protein
MHPEVRRHEVPAQLVPKRAAADDAGGGEHPHAHVGEGLDAACLAGVWEDDMVDVNRITTPAHTSWSSSTVDRRRGQSQRRLSLDLPSRGQPDAQGSPAPPLAPGERIVSSV